MIPILVLKIALAWLGVGLVTGFIIGYNMGCRKRGDYTQ